MVPIFDTKFDEMIDFYINSVAPVLIEEIKKFTTENFLKIKENLSTPLFSNPFNFLMGVIKNEDQMINQNFRVCVKEPLGAQDKYFLLTRVNYLYDTFRKEESEFIQGFERNLNECLVDFFEEFLEKQRKFGNEGVPLPWESYERKTHFAISDEKYGLNSLLNNLDDTFYSLVTKNLGKIRENRKVKEDNFRSTWEAKINSVTASEVTFVPKYEVEETAVKMEIADYVLEQLYHEVIEILGHVSYSRHFPEKYQNKSIYSCEEIPKLPFQIFEEGE